MTTQLIAGLELLVVGMGIVFLFLTLLVVAVAIMSRLIMRFLPEVAVEHSRKKNASLDHSVTAAITTAIRQYRAKHQAEK
jgi:oxaloacetate decarboxylase gamma subunit